MADASEMTAILDRFQETLDRLRLGPDEFVDESELADPKPAIEAALAAAIRGEAAPELAPSKLHGMLAALAQFQPGVGAPILDPASEVARRMTAARECGVRVDTKAIQAAVSEVATNERWTARRARHAADVSRDRTRLLGLLAGHW